MQPILKIDLSNGSHETKTVLSEWIENYIGGASLAARMLYDHMVQDLDPLSPDSPILFLTGPLTGTSGPAVGRYVICGRSPATKIWGESNCGGFWGPELRKAGYDGLWITGKAEKPIYVILHNKNVEIRSASHIWGLDTYETQDQIIRETGLKNARIASIGVAGERLVPFALILCDHGRVAGRTGMGALMGSKNIKAIVVKGNGTIPVKKEREYKELRSKVNQTLRNDVQTTILRELGTASSAEYFDFLEELPKKYYQQGKSTGELRSSGAGMKETILSGISACHACVIACGRVVTLNDKKKRKGPEYETIAGFGPNLLIDDLAKITQFGELCDRYGIDTISMSNITGLVFDLFDQGLITKADTGGLEFNWGDPANIDKLIWMTAHRVDFGSLLAEGARSVAKHYGVEDQAVQVKGLEAAYHDPRGSSGMALVYATSPRGACHNQSGYYLVDLGKVESRIGMEYFDRLAGAEKASNVVKHQNWISMFNSLVLCKFANVPPQDLRELINLATGQVYSFADLLRIGERAWNLKRIINYHFGMRKADDTLPKRFLQPYHDNGEDSMSSVPHFEEMLEAYYLARGWNPETAYPSREKIAQLNLGWAESDSIEHEVLD